MYLKRKETNLFFRYITQIFILNGTLIKLRNHDEGIAYVKCPRFSNWEDLCDKKKYKGCSEMINDIIIIIIIR